MQYNPEELNEILKIYKAENEEIIQELNDNLLILEKTPTDKTPLKKLLQLAHSLKSAARMIGFNSIQDIAHKLEDILSYWKKDDVVINVDFFQKIYETCDFINVLIDKSIAQKSNYVDENVMLFINNLDEFISLNNILVKDVNQIQTENYIVTKSIDINAIVLEIIFALDKNEDETVDDIISVVSDNIIQLKEIFDLTEYSQLKDKIDEYKNYVTDSDIKNINLAVCKAKILDLKNDIYKIYKELNVKTNLPKEKKREIIHPQQSTVTEENIAIRLDAILAALPQTKKDKSSLAKILENIKFVVEHNQNKQIETILLSSERLLNLFIEKDVLLNNECYLILLQSLYLAKRISINETENTKHNIESIQQRLSVVEDMFTVQHSPAVMNNNVIQKQDNAILEKTGFAEIQNRIHNIELQEIKTLRVDTEKIDDLISQTGELLINGIKTRKHISELSKINAKINNWNTNSKTVLNYLKYLEKRGFFNEQLDESVFAFYKRTQNFFIDNSEFISELNNDLNRLYNIISEDDNKLHQTVIGVENIAKGIRVLPLATIFHTFPRMIRDIAKEKNKEIDFIISGSDTTVDKKIIEEIKMPLIHILRNAVSHGIEIPEVRTKNGKDRMGIIKLSAKIVENNVLITIMDDGYGINIMKVKEKALKKGLLSQEDADSLSYEQLMKLLFLPGFSTEESVSDISGRGIGLDIVKTKITNLNGEIFVDSALNKGCSVTIKIPLSMSTLKAFLLNVDNQKYAIPVNAIKYVIRIKKEEIFNKNGRDCILYNEHSVPIYNLSSVLNGEDKYFIENDVLTVIIIKNQDKTAAYIVDELIGDSEIFQKKLTPPILRIKNISGFTTLSSGEICLMINPYELIRNTVENEQISLLSLKQLSLEDKLKSIADKKIVLFDCEDCFEFLRNDINSYFNSVSVFNNINSVYDYIIKNGADAIICKINNNSNDIIRLLKYVKSDENYINMKLIIFSDLSEYEISEYVKDYEYNLYVRFAKYKKEEFLNKFAKLF